jgi:hypothetical protein
VAGEDSPAAQRRHERAALAGLGGTKPRSVSISSAARSGSSNSARTMTDVGATGPPTCTRSSGSAIQSRSGTTSATVVSAAG